MTTRPDTEAPGYPRLEPDPRGFCWLVFDDPDHVRNVLTEEALQGLRACLAEVNDLAAREEVRALVVWSPAAKGFIIGTDVARIEAIGEEAEAREAIHIGQDSFQLLADLEIPTVAGIDGLCLGGGTELALACDWRVASSGELTRIGCPEVRLGIFPAWGGTTRLPRLIGLRHALPLILSGRSLTPSRARAVGLVDRVLPADNFRSQVGHFAAGLAGTSSFRAPARKPRRKFPGAGWVLENTRIGRRVLFRKARRTVMKQTGGHYPAPLKVLEVVERSLGKPVPEGLRQEAREAAPLIVSPTSKNLIHLFNMRERAREGFRVSDMPWGGRKPAGMRDSAEAGAHFELIPSSPPASIGILGGGTVGGILAHLAASRGMEVHVAGPDPEARAEAVRVARAHLRTAVERGALEPGVAEVAGGRVRTCSDIRVMAGPELVLVTPTRHPGEAAVLLPELEGKLGHDAVLVSVLASDPAAGPTESLAETAELLARPGRFCGLHLIGPERHVPLMEVVQGESTVPAALAKAHGMVRRMGKTPVVVRDGPGLLVNRLLKTARQQIGRLREEGLSLSYVTSACLAFGWALRSLGLPEGGRAAGELEPDTLHQEIQDCIGLAVVGEAASALAEGVASRAGDVDLAMVLAGGFPAFRGGLLRDADAGGPAYLLSRFRNARERWGESFSPGPVIRRLAESGRTFYETFG